MIDINELRPAVEVAGLNAISMQEVLELLDRLEVAEKERTIDEQRIADLMADLNRVGHENDALRARIEAMEKLGDCCVDAQLPDARRRYRMDSILDAIRCGPVQQTAR